MAKCQNKERDTMTFYYGLEYVSQNVSVEVPIPKIQNVTVFREGNCIKHEIIRDVAGFLLRD